MNAMPKRRDKSAIIGEILQTARPSALKTRIMFKANLSFTQLNEYLSQMTAMGLLKKTTENERQAYATTQKGLDFLRRQRELMRFLTQDALYTDSQRFQPENLLVKIRKEEN